MNNLIIKGVDLNPFELTCNAYMEDIGYQEDFSSDNIFELFFHWVNKYCENYFFDIEFNINVSLIDRFSVNNIFNTVEELSECSKKGHHIVVNWYCFSEDIEMKETINNFRNIIKLPINIINKNKVI